MLSPVAGRARAVIFTTLAMCLALQLGLAIAIDVGLPKLRDSTYAYKASRLRRLLRWLEREFDPPPGHKTAARVVLFLGSSRTLQGIDAEQLSLLLSERVGQPIIAYNFGVPGAGPVRQRLILERLLAEGIRPDLLVVEVLPPFLSDQGPVPLEMQQLPASMLYPQDLRLLERDGLPTRRLRHDWWQSWPIPWHTHRFNLVSLVDPGLLPMRLRQDCGGGTDGAGTALPYLFNVSSERRRQALDHARNEYAGYFRDFHLGGPTCQSLDRLLARAREARIPTSLLLMPEGPTFRSWYPPGAWPAIEAFLEQMGAKHAAAPIHARNWMPEEAFVDSHHLLPEGAEQLTARLGTEALVPLLQPLVE